MDFTAVALGRFLKMLITAALVAVPLSASGEKSPEQKLFSAIRQEKPKRVSKWISAGADVNYVTEDGRHPLTQALKNRGPEIFVALIQAGAELPSSAAEAPAKRRKNWWNEVGAWMFRRGAKQRRLPVKVLLEAGVLPPRYPEPERLLGLYEAGRFRMLQSLVMSADITGAEALCWAIKFHDTAIFEDLLSRNWRMWSCKRNFGRKAFPLRVAARHGHLDFVRALLDAGATANRRRLLSTAVKAGHFEIVDMLIEAGADVDGHPRSRPLFAAIGKDRTKMLEHLLKAGADPNLSWRGEGTVPLMAAIDSKSPRSMELLLEHGADPRLDSRSGSMLEMAQKTGNLEVLEILLTALNEDPPSVEAPGTKLGDRVMTADPPLAVDGFLKWCRPEKLNLFLEFGGDPSMETASGPAVHTAALDCDNMDLLDLLLAAGAEMDQVDDQGRTALDKLVGTYLRDPSQDLLLRIDELLGRGADPDGQGRRQLAQRLIEAGANLRAFDDKGLDLDAYRWKGLTRKNKRRLIRRRWVQVSVEQPDHYELVTGEARHWARQSPGPNRDQIAELIFAAYLGNHERPIRIVFFVSPWLTHVSLDKAQMLYPDLHWNEHLRMTNGRIAVGATTRRPGGGEPGAYDSIESVGLMSWSPASIYVLVSGPSDREAEIRWIRKGVLNNLRLAKPLTFKEKMRFTRAEFAVPLRQLRDASIQGIRLILLVGFFATLVILVGLRESQQGQPKIDILAVLIKTLALLGVFVVSWIASFTGFYYYDKRPPEISTTMIWSNQGWISESAQVVASGDGTWTSPNVMLGAFLLFLAVIGIGLLWRFLASKRTTDEPRMAEP